jgi:hypothetical protein
VPPSLVGGSVLVEVELVLDREVLDPDVTPVLALDDAPTEVEAPLLTLPPLLPPLVPPLLVLTFEVPRPPDVVLDTPPAVEPPGVELVPRVELVPEADVDPPGFNAPDPPPQAATMTATDTTAKERPRNMPVQGPGPTSFASDKAQETRLRCALGRGARLAPLLGDFAAVT